MWIMALDWLRPLYSAVVPRRGRLDLLLHRVFSGRVRLRLGFYEQRAWITSFRVDGKRYGGSVSFDEDARLAHFSARFPPPARVLELGRSAVAYEKVEVVQDDASYKNGQSSIGA